jgi:cytochrome c556
MKRIAEVVVNAAFILLASIVPAGIPAAFAQAPTTRQLMLDLIYPSSNDILLAVYRGGPSDDKEWAVIRHSALALAESGNTLMTQGRSSSDAKAEEWLKAVKLLTDAGSEAYKAAQAKDAKALAAVTARIDASCTNCHKQFRPNVFPRQAGP